MEKVGEREDLIKDSILIIFVQCTKYLGPCCYIPAFQTTCENISIKSQDWGNMA